jgi:hydroxymethylglutaryl-CoA reductase
MMASSRIPGFYRLPPSARLGLLVENSPLQATDAAALRGDALTLDRADHMVENVVGTMALPLGVGLNLRVNGEDVLVPMVVEEPSVVAAVSNMARLVREAGGFTAGSTDSLMIGQVQLTAVPDLDAAEAAVRAATPRLMAMADAVHPRLRERGGGPRRIDLRRLRYDEPGQTAEDMLVVHIVVDCVDAMGANLVNTVAERLAPTLEALTGGVVGLRILSNLAAERRSWARCAIPAALLATPESSGAEVAAGIASAYRFAWADPYRAATHNKGVMNGIDAVALATGNDWRAIEAGAHAWAARDGQYRSMTRWTVDANDVLHGEIDIPIQVGTVGGSILNHPTVAANLRLMGSPRAAGLGAIMAAVGLAQNLGALRALATEGIQQGHMRMHSRNLAVQAGAEAAEVPAVVAALSAAGDWSVERARAALLALRAAGPA